MSFIDFVSSVFLLQDSILELFRQCSIIVFYIIIISNFNDILYENGNHTHFTILQDDSK